MPKGFVGNIEEITLENSAYRRVVFTGPKLQLVVMAIPPGVEIGMEVHDGDQFIRLEEGQATAILDGVSTELHTDDVVIIPAGTQHNIINSAEEGALKLYTVYTPPEHADGTVEQEKPEHEEH